jgi:hypothetical protein
MRPADARAALRQLGVANGTCSASRKRQVRYGDFTHETMFTARSLRVPLCR